MIRYEHITRSGGWFAILLIFCNAIGVGAGDVKEVPRISVHQVKQMLGHPDVVIIDVRKYRNWWRSTKKILTAVREDPSEVDQWNQKYSRDKTLVFYCA
jgi:predicted sulfurtransferase